MSIKRRCQQNYKSVGRHTVVVSFGDIKVRIRFILRSRINNVLKNTFGAGRYGPGDITELGYCSPTTELLLVNNIRSSTDQCQLKSQLLLSLKPLSLDTSGIRGFIILTASIQIDLSFDVIQTKNARRVIVSTEYKGVVGK